jgi:hypothetical protein
LISEPLEKPCHDACTPDIFNDWFSRYQEHFDRYKPDPHDIYNIDETGFILGEGEKAYIIIDKKRGSSNHRIKAKKGELLTAIECVSATRTAIAPMIIYKGEYLQHHWFEPGAPRDWIVATSPKGWTSNALGLWWLQNHFEPSTRVKNDGYRFLLLDGHGSHLTPEFQSFCAEKKIILLCIPAHTSHMLQPLDVGVFSSIKHYFRRAVERRLRAGYSRFPKAEFLQTYYETRPQGMTERNIKSGWRKTGLVPFNPDKAIQRLPLPLLSTPPRSPSHISSVPIQTPQNHGDLVELEKQLSGSLSTVVQAAKKISKAATLFHSWAIIAEAEYNKLHRETHQAQEAAYRK